IRDYKVTGVQTCALPILTFLERLPAAELPAVADLAVVDDGSAITGEVMNLLARRNLLFEVVPSPAARFRINIVVGGNDYPRDEEIGRASCRARGECRRGR